MNTGMLYSNAIAAQAETLGFKGIMADGNPAMLKGFTSNEVFLAPWVYNTTTMFRNRELSNDLAVMRTDPEWPEYPLSPATFADWLTHQQGSVTTLSMDYETLGERQSDATGVFEFWRTMILACVDAGNRFMTPSEVVREIKPVSVCECTQEMTCSTFGTMSHWNGNVMQDEAIRKIYRLENRSRPPMTRTSPTSGASSRARTTSITCRRKTPLPRTPLPLTRTSTT